MTENLMKRISGGKSAYFAVTVAHLWENQKVWGHHVVPSPWCLLGDVMRDLPYAEKAHIVRAARLERERERVCCLYQTPPCSSRCFRLHLTECNVWCVCAMQKLCHLDRRTTQCCVIICVTPLPLWRFTSELCRQWFQVMSCHGLS